MVIGCGACYTGSLLGWAWQLVEQRYQEELDEHTRDPYPVLGERAFGKAGRCVFPSVWLGDLTGEGDWGFSVSRGEKEGKKSWGHTL